MKFTGNFEPAVSPGLEDFEQMTVQTDQLNLYSGFGQASTQVNFVSRRGSNQYHGRVYEDFRNAVFLNANSWANEASNQRKDCAHPQRFRWQRRRTCLPQQTFFFGTFAMHARYLQPSTPTDDILTSAAQGGNFTYKLTCPTNDPGCTLPFDDVNSKSFTDQQSRTMQTFPTP